MDDPVELPVAAAVQPMTVRPSRARGQRRRSVRHGELRLGPVTPRVADLSKDLACGEVCNAGNGCQRCGRLSSQSSQLPGDLVDFGEELPKPKDPFTREPSTGAGHRDEQPPGSVELDLVGQLSDPCLVARRELFQVRMEPAGQAVAFGHQLTAIVDEVTQVLDLAGRADCRQIAVAEYRSGDNESIDRVRLGLVAPMTATQGRQLWRYFDDLKALPQQGQAGLAS